MPTHHSGLSLAWPPPPEQLRTVQEAKQHLILTGESRGGVRTQIARSWQRSLHHGVQPGLTSAPTSLQGSVLAAARSDYHLLLEAARPLLTELETLIRGSGQVILLCDAAARILLACGDREGRRATEPINLGPGANWSEAAAGTNAMGLALTEKRPVLVLANEHFCSGWEHWSCAATPIRDPITGVPVGILDISGAYRVLNEHSLAAVVAAARAIEGRLQQAHLTAQHRLFATFADLVVTSGAAVLAIDAGGRLLRATPGAEPLLAGDPPGPVPEFACLLAAVLASGRTESQRLSGAGALFEVTCKPVTDQGAPVGAIALVRPCQVQPPPPPAAAPLSGFVGSHPEIVRVLDRAARAARSDVTVLITGETGTGKEVLAGALHAASSRVRGPFVAVNCGALPPTLAASELFGYDAGAFTGAARRGSAGKVAAAQGGTLFLDEVGELPPDVQVMLLRLLQEKEVVRVGGQRPAVVDVRVIAATNRDLEAMVAAGQFRADLYYRLNVVRLHLPPLRERRDDIPLLVRHALALEGEPHHPVPPEVLARLHAYDWPGNVRELFNLVRQALVMAEPLDAQWPASRLPIPLAVSAPAPSPDPEREAVLAALTQTGGNVAAAARRLGVGRSTLYRKIHELGICLERQAR